MQQRRRPASFRGRLKHARPQLRHALRISKHGGKGSRGLPARATRVNGLRVVNRGRRDPGKCVRESQLLPGHPPFLQMVVHQPSRPTVRAS